jgi:hypothetical protein
MELKLYNRLKHQLLGEFAERAERHDRDYQHQVETFTSRQHSGLPKPTGRKIQGWLWDYNKIFATKPFSLRYYQILALYFTEHVLEIKRSNKGYQQQRALVYWMATGSGKTLLMHLNILQYISHIGGVQAFDELQLILTTPGVNLIDQHERELGEVVQQLNRICNNRIKLIVATTGALLNYESGFFKMPESKRLFRLVLVDEGHIGLASGGKDIGAFKQLRQDLLKPENSFLFEYSATYHGIAEQHVREYEEQIVYDYNYYRFYKDGYGKDYSLQALNDDRFADQGKNEAVFFETTFETLNEKFLAHGNLTVKKTDGVGHLPFIGRFPDKPLLAFMGNTVEDPGKEGSDKDEVSDIRKFVVWLAYLTPEERSNYKLVFNNQHTGKLTLTRSPGIQDEIWLSWGDGPYWGLINVGNGDKFFSDCDNHPQLHDSGGEFLVALAKAAIIKPTYRFSAIDDPASPINVLVGSRKFAEGWNCFRLSIIGLINLGSTKGNKIIQIFGRGVRLKGLGNDGKRQNLDHCTDYVKLVKNKTPENQLWLLETLNVFSLKRSWLQTFLKALEHDLPAISGPFLLEVTPNLVKIGKRKLKFEKYQPKLHAFKVGLSEFDSPLWITLDGSNHAWHWEYLNNGETIEGTILNPGFSLDYRSDRKLAGHNLVQSLRACLDGYSYFLPTDWLQQRLLIWSRQQRVQLYFLNNEQKHQLRIKDMLPALQQVLYDHRLKDRSWSIVEKLLDTVQRDFLEKILHKVRYVIDKRRYRYGTLRQSNANVRGDFIDRYAMTYEFRKDEKRRQFENNPLWRKKLEKELKEATTPYHIYDPLFRESTELLLKEYNLQRIGLSPDKLNPGECKFLRDILQFIETNYSKNHQEFYLMRNVESLRSIGLYLEGETRVFYPDFVLWIVDDKTKKTTLVLFDPKGQTGIVKKDDLGIQGPDGMNDKVRVATSGQLLELARELELRTKRHWLIRSYILLRDSSPLGRFKGSSPTDLEMELVEAMVGKGVLRLDWHEKKENGQTGVLLRGGQNYLSRIFENIIS